MANLIFFFFPAASDSFNESSKIQFYLAFKNRLTHSLIFINYAVRKCIKLKLKIIHVLNDV